MADEQNFDWIETLTSLAPFFEQVVPLVQTSLWVLLILLGMLVFRKPILAIMQVVKDRVEGGSGIKAGAFELTELQPQTVETQKQKLEDEIGEQTSEPKITDAPPKMSGAQQGNVRATYLQAEDLALRALQDDFGTSISRQVTAGPDLGFDGSFVVDGTMHVVEVRVVRSPRDVFNIRKAFDQLVGAISRNHWKNVKLIVVVVFWGDTEEDKVKKTLSELSSSAQFETEVRFYRLDELRSQFGL